VRPVPALFAPVLRLVLGPVFGLVLGPVFGLVLGLVLGLAGCRGRAPLASCDDDLRGIYSVPDAAGRRWMILDSGDALEIYPLFPDAAPGPAPGLEVAPRVLHLRRAPDKLAGSVHRRYMRGARQCVAKVPVRITACGGDALELVISDPEPPIEWPAAPEQPCGWPRPGSSRVERWIRE
jgi:hypothetical protein